MANMFLLKEAIDNIAFQDFQSGIDNLILIDKQEEDIFYKNSELDTVQAYFDLYQNPSQENQIRTIYLEQLAPYHENPKSVEELSALFPESTHGFFGINFPQLTINEDFCVNDNVSFIEFKKHWQTMITHENFSELKIECFPNIIFCDDSEKQLTGYGNSKYFGQCIDQFIELEIYLKQWTQGNFSYQDLARNTNITLSPESPTTMRKYSCERVFSLPNGERRVFELHIKLGDIRIHILEDNTQKKIMVGYIGSHLTI